MYCKNTRAYDYPYMPYHIIGHIRLVSVPCNFIYSVYNQEKRRCERKIIYCAMRKRRIKYIYRYGACQADGNHDSQKYKRTYFFCHLKPFLSN